MKSKPIGYWLFGLIFMASACIQIPLELTEGGNAIQLLQQPEEFPQCIYIDNFHSITLASNANSYQQALIKIKNNVAVYQGTHLTIKSSDTDDLVTRIMGEGYRCPLTESGQIQDMIINPSYQTIQ